MIPAYVAIIAQYLFETADPYPGSWVEAPDDIRNKYIGRASGVVEVLRARQYIIQSHEADKKAS